MTIATHFNEESKFKKPFVSKYKLKDSDMTKESFKRKDYLTKMTMTNSRVKLLFCPTCSTLPEGKDLSNDVHQI